MTNSKDFKDFSEKDFINDPYFQDWTIHPDQEKNRFWAEFMKAHPEKIKTIENAKTLLNSISFKETWPTDEQVDGSLNKALKRINSNEKRNSIHKISGKVHPFHRTWWAAAAVLILVVAGWLFMNNRNERKPSLTATHIAKDVAPGGDKAVLTLADGRKVILDTAGNGAITIQGGIKVIKLNGQLAYNNDGVASTEILYNTITTPKGGQYQLLMADGSKVWLNASSSLRFPTTFKGAERKVELTGEGYFEVAHNPMMPFIVKNGEAEVKVLGTHFNINSYQNEPSSKVTLLEGRVMIKRNDHLVYLNPGQQGILHPAQDNITIANDVDLEEVIAWKNGLFIFNNTPLENIMRQIERWYNVNVVYEGTTPQDKFNGNISRNTNLSEVLKVLEYSNIRFSVQGNTITVLPPK